MNGEFEDTVRKLIAERGKEALLDADKCRGLLDDYRPNEYERGEYETERDRLLQVLCDETFEGSSERCGPCKANPLWLNPYLEPHEIRAEIAYEERRMDELNAMRIRHGLILVLIGGLLCWWLFGCATQSVSAPHYDVWRVFDYEAEEVVWKACEYALANPRDVNLDGRLTCIDFARLFVEGFNPTNGYQTLWMTYDYVWNLNRRNGMNHLFVIVDFANQYGQRVRWYVEPKTSRSEGSFHMADQWGEKWDHSYDMKVSDWSVYDNGWRQHIPGEGF